MTPAQRFAPGVCILLAGCMHLWSAPKSSPQRVALPLAGGGQAEPIDVSAALCITVAPTVYFSKLEVQRSAAVSRIAEREPFLPIRVVLTLDREVPPGSGRFALKWRTLDVTSSQTESWSAAEVGRILAYTTLPRGRYRVRAEVPVAIPALGDVAGHLELWSSFKSIPPSSAECARAERGDA